MNIMNGFKRLNIQILVFLAIITIPTILMFGVMNTLIGVIPIAIICIYVIHDIESYEQKKKSPKKDQ
ncbi:hypothetical protein [Candidatus Enterococcus lemimoniae]|uniref:Uncharacterized protein n=1 Tax=Candidatus Enterococcus lemimoniae TaxID=1834167 RepID=A0ABZ2T5Y0_9ENTE|nr:hypothetical protein A5866_001968 [Enterococcus sp. 12C11_DIV0727]